MTNFQRSPGASAFSWGGWLVAGLALVAAAWFWTKRPRPVAAQPKMEARGVVPPPVPDPAVAPQTQGPESWEAVVRKSLPALVQIETSRGQGTGFFIAPDTLLTNVHVVSGASYVTVRFVDNSTVQASVTKSEPECDVALLKLWSPRSNQIVIPLGSAGDLQPGQEVVAIGSPHGIQNTVTRGIVSGLRRVGSVALVQTDAALNPGNSGGPLLDRGGQAVGINTLSFRQAQGINFAVAIEHAKALAEGRPQQVPHGFSAASRDASQHIPDPVAPSETEQQRIQGTQIYEARLAVIAQRASALDDYWVRFMASGFDGQVSGNFDRPWCVVWEPDRMQGNVRKEYLAAYQDILRKAEEIRGMVKFTEDAARRADVYPGVRRELRQRYRLSYPGWDK